MPAPTPTPAPLPPTSPTTTSHNVDMADPPDEVSAASGTDGVSIKQRTRKRVRPEQGSELEDKRPTTRARKAELEVGTRVTRTTTTQSRRGGGAVRGKGGVAKAKRR